MWDSVTLYVKDQAALAEREALERVSRAKVENTTTLASTREDAKGLAWKIALLEDELAVEGRAQEVSKWEHREQFEELTLLQTRGFELCHAIIDPPQARHHLSEGMRLAGLHHTTMARELIVLWAVVSTAIELVLGCSPPDTFCVEVVRELATKL
jgi:hypothetical protein